MLNPLDIVEKFKHLKASALAQTDSDRKVLAKYANKVPENGVIVEIGTRYGWSAALLALASPKTARVWTLDYGPVAWCGKNFLYPVTAEEERQFSEELAKRRADYETSVYKNLKKMGCDNKVTFLYGSSHHEGWIGTVHWPHPKKIDLLFIDGDHRYDAVMADLLRWAPKVKVGGHMLLHDYGFAPPHLSPAELFVKGAVNDYLGAHPREWKKLEQVSVLLVCQRAQLYVKKHKDK